MPLIPWTFLLVLGRKAKKRVTKREKQKKLLTLYRSCVYPFFANIPQVKWYTFPGTSHMSNVEQPERYMEVVSQFLMSV